jgi:hypothetical protein
MFSWFLILPDRTCLRPAGIFTQNKIYGRQFQGLSQKSRIRRAD